MPLVVNHACEYRACANEATEKVISRDHARRASEMRVCREHMQVLYNYLNHDVKVSIVWCVPPLPRWWRSRP